MHLNKIGFILGVVILLLIGGLVTFCLLEWNLISVSFFNCSLIEILRLVIMLFLGCYVAYWISIKSDAIQKKKDLCLILINEGNKILSEQKELTISFTKQENDQNDGKLVLSGFRRLNNKLDSINKLCKKINENISADNLIEEFKKIKELFGNNYISENYMSGFDSEASKALVKNFDKFEKLFDDIRIQILI